MNCFVLFYQNVANYKEKRKEFRNEHLSLAKKYYEQGYLLAGGGLEDSEKAALLIFTDKIHAENFIKEDPYIYHKVIKIFSIHPWNLAIGGFE